MYGQNLYIHLYLTIDLPEKKYLLASPQLRRRDRVVHEQDEHTIAVEPVFHTVHVRPSLSPNVQRTITHCIIYAGIYRDSITYHALSPDTDSTFGSEKELWARDMGIRPSFYGNIW